MHVSVWACSWVALLAGCQSGPAPRPYVPPPPDVLREMDPGPDVMRRIGEATGGVVARVNDSPITDWELEQRLPPPYRVRDRWKESDIAKIVIRTVRSLAEHRILMDAAASAGLSVADDEVEAEIRKEREDMKLTPDEFRRQVEQQSGRPYVNYVDDIRDQLLIQKLISRQMYGLYVPPVRIRSQYAENPKTFTEEATVSFRMLLISSARAGGSEKAKALADAIHRQLVLGGDFDALVAAYRSFAPESASAGGRLSNVPRGRLPAAVEQAVFDPAQPVPGLTPVLPFSSDWAVVRLEERRESRLRPYEDAQLQKGISRALLHEQYIARRAEILREHLQRASIWPPGLFPPDYPATRP